MWIYQRVDLLHFGYYLYLDTICGSKRVDLLYIGCCLHPKVDSLDREIGYIHFILLDTKQITGYRHCVVVDAKRITACWIQWTNLTVG